MMVFIMVVIFDSYEHCFNYTYLNIARSDHDFDS